MNTIDNRICRTQGQFYSYMAKKKYDMNVFSDVFMHSDFCKRHFDTVYSPYQTEFPKAIYELCMPEIETLLVRKTYMLENDRCFSESVGFIYRRLYQETNISSAELAELIPYNEILNYFADDGEWFEAEHKGAEGIFSDIMEKYHLPCKRYDADIKILTDEQFRKMQQDGQIERLHIEEKYL